MDTRQRVLDVLSATMPQGADVAVVDERGNAYVIQLKTGTRFEARWLHRGWPAQVRAALEEGHRPDLFVAPRMSPGARDVAQREDAGWADETGAAAFVVGPVVVAREPRRDRSQGTTKHAWTPAALAVAEALLTGTRATVADVAGRTELADGTVSKALRVMTDEGLLHAVARRGRRSRRWLTDPAGLLDRYAEVAADLRSDLSLRVGIDVGDVLGDVVHAGRSWTHRGRRWAATGALAAHVQAAYLQTPSPVEVYLDATSVAGLVAAAGEGGLRELEGGRLALRPFPSRATAALSTLEHQGGHALPCVPWPRTYADLRVTGVRGEEAAEHLRVRYLPEPESPDA